MQAMPVYTKGSKDAIDCLQLGTAGSNGCSCIIHVLFSVSAAQSDTAVLAIGC